MPYNLWIDIGYRSGEVTVVFNREYVNYGEMRTRHEGVTRESLVRVQRMQLKLFDAMKGQSPDVS